MFTGGIVVTSNRALDNWPELAAIKTRVAVMQFQPTQHEVRALMRDVARKERVHEDAVVPAVACVEVCEFVIAECRGLNRPLDMRLLDNAIGDYVQATMYGAGCGWRDLVMARIVERAPHFREEVVIGGRHEQRDADLVVIRQICAEVKGREERVKLWQQRTGKSQATFYRRLKEIGTGRNGAE